MVRRPTPLVQTLQHRARVQLYRPETPRVEVCLLESGTSGHLGQIAPPSDANPRGVWTYDAWRFSLRSRAVTNRRRTGDFHRQLLASVRLQALYFNARFTTDVLPFHVPTEIKEAGVHRYVDRETDSDITEITHTGLLSVRAGAWPALV